MRSAAPAMPIAPPVRMPPDGNVGGSAAAADLTLAPAPLLAPAGTTQDTQAAIPMPDGSLQVTQPVHGHAADSARVAWADQTTEPPSPAGSSEADLHGNWRLADDRDIGGSAPPPPDGGPAPWDESPPPPPPQLAAGSSTDRAPVVIPPQARPEGPSQEGCSELDNGRGSTAAGSEAGEFWQEGGPGGLTGHTSTTGHTTGRRRGASRSPEAEGEPPLRA